MTTIRPVTPETTSSAPHPVSPPTSLTGKIRWVGITGIVLAVLLSVAEVLLVLSAENNGTATAAVGALFMTAPVVLARRWPILAVCIVAVATIANGLLWDDIVRCGAAVPALLYISFAVGSRSRLGSDDRPTGSWLRSLLGLGLALVAVVAQGIWDPALGADFYPFGIPLVLIAWGAGIGWATVEGRRRA